PGCRQVSTDEAGISVEERLRDVLREVEVGVPITGIVVVVEDAADAARLVAVLEKEVLVAPLLVAEVVNAVGLAGGTVRRMESETVRVGLGAPALENRRQVATTAEPPVAGDDHAYVH